MLSIHLLSQLNTFDFKKWHILNSVVLFDTQYTHTHKSTCDIVLAYLTQYWPRSGIEHGAGTMALSWVVLQLWVPICRNVRIKILYYDSWKESSFPSYSVSHHPDKIMQGYKTCINANFTWFLSDTWMWNRGAGGKWQHVFWYELGVSGSQLLIHTRLFVFAPSVTSDC